MSHSLSQPSASLSHKILNPVPFKARFPAGRLKPPVGVLPGDVRSLPELHLFLEPDDASLPGINLKCLPEYGSSKARPHQFTAMGKNLLKCYSSSEISQSEKKPKMQSGKAKNGSDSWLKISMKYFS